MGARGAIFVLQERDSDILLSHSPESGRLDPHPSWAARGWRASLLFAVQTQVLNHENPRYNVSCPLPLTNTPANDLGMHLNVERPVLAGLCWPPWQSWAWALG